jgi:hypothetical protein
VFAFVEVRWTEWKEYLQSATVRIDWRSQWTPSSDPYPSVSRGIKLSRSVQFGECADLKNRVEFREKKGGA